MSSKRTFHDPTQQAAGRAARWINEPLKERHPSMTVHTKRPFNAEPSNLALQHMYTPKGQHYRRAHAPVPLINDNEYRLKIEIENSSDSNCIATLSLIDIKKKAQKEVSVTLMCTGNRRGEFNKYGGTAGLPWKNGSISTAKWRGCLLKDILNDCGIHYNDMKSKGYNFLTMWGLEGYHISIPLQKAMDIDGECILSYIMNDEPLPRDHGAPLRVIIPGYVGARSVKWIDRIIITKNVVESMHQTGIAYKQLPPNCKDFGQLNKKMIAELPPIDIIPVTSAITAPHSPSIKLVRGQIIDIKGYAFSGGGRAIIRVDVSVDNGRTWEQAKLKYADKQSNNRNNKTWAWTQWNYQIKVPQNIKKLNICCKAIDDQYNQQPHSVEPIWNLRGILNTSWPRLTLETNGSRL